MRVVKHLGLDPFAPNALAEATAPAKANARASSRSMAMPKKAGVVLGAFYAPFNRELAALTEDDGFLWLNKKDDPQA